MNIEIGSAFELLSDEEWNNYLSTTIFEDMLISINLFEKYRKRIFLYPRLSEIINGHNNKIKDLKITYALCRHYYDKGIPDDPWYISPGSNGESVQYFPQFEKEHQMRRYWFNHFSESLYLKFFSVWDGVIEILNIFFNINESTQDYRFKKNVMNQLKSKKVEMHKYLISILQDDVYIKANSFRTDFVHGFAPSTVTNKYVLDNTEKEMELLECKNGMVKIVKKNVKTKLSHGVGEYTFVREVMENIDSFAKYSGDRISEIIQLMIRYGD
ncbi:Cthe_2314 family HEPN domain-containing protein [Dolosigranulum savutiense]|uniref:Cthe_2314 family HEPN domain-containing protein n=1 Tax=Dolosigranulum savutiense TaxID=3110288 RepID=A0AB74TUS3_9LACT